MAVESTAEESKEEEKKEDDTVRPVSSFVTKGGNVIHWHSYLRHVPRGPAGKTPHLLLFTVLFGYMVLCLSCLPVLAVGLTPPRP